MTPPVLIDLNSDGVKDIVFSTFNSTVLALDGADYTQLWNSSFPQSETYATPAPGFYNNDSVPDFMVRWQHGPGFPIYYHSTMTVLDGKNGEPLLQPYPRDSVGAQTSPISLSLQGTGNDLFLYWVADCVGHQGDGGEFGFMQGTNIHEKSRADLCRSRFKADGYSRQYVYSAHTGLPGGLVYDSTTRKDIEHAQWENTTAIAWQFLLDHPQHMQQYEFWTEYVNNQREAWRRGDKRTSDSEQTPVDEQEGDWRIENEAEVQSEAEVQKEAGIQSEAEPALRIVPEDSLGLRTELESRPEYSGLGGYAFPPVLPVLERDDNNDYFPSNQEYSHSNQEYHPSNQEYSPSNDGFPRDSFYSPNGKYSASDQLSFPNTQKYSSNTRYPLPSNHYPSNNNFFLDDGKYGSHGNRQGEQYGRRGDERPNEFSSILSNIFEKRREKGRSHHDRSSILRDLQETQRKFNPFSAHKSRERWPGARNRDVMSDYGRRGRRDVTQVTPSDGDYDVIDTETNADVTPNLPKEIPNSGKSKTGKKTLTSKTHNSFSEMTSQELQQKLQRTLQKVATIQEKEEKRLQRKNKKRPSKSSRIKAMRKGVVDSSSAGYHGYHGYQHTTTNPSTLPNIRRTSSLPLGGTSVVSQSRIGGVKWRNSTHEASAGHARGVKEEKRTEEGKNVDVTEGSENVREGERERSERTSFPREGGQEITKEKSETVSSAKDTVEKNEEKDVKKTVKRRRTGSPDTKAITKDKGRKSGGKKKGGKKREKQKRNDGRKKRRRRRKRHVGPHDEGGVQRLISTGTLAPSLLPPSHPDHAHSMDVIFATYWFFPAKTEVILPEDQECIQKKLQRETERFSPESKYYRMDHDAYQHEIEEECLEKSGHTLPKDKTYESQMSYNPYDLHMGQLTVYRIRIKCSCVESDTVLHRHGKTCAKMLPFNEQQWAAYMGSHGDSHWLPRKLQKHGHQPSNNNNS